MIRISIKWSVCMRLTSTNSWVSLNADVSKPRFLPGEIDRMKPKSMWITWPSASSKMLPLCLHSQQTTTGNTMTKKKQTNMITCRNNKHQKFNTALHILRQSSSPPTSSFALERIDIPVLTNPASPWMLAIKQVELVFGKLLLTCPWLAWSSRRGCMLHSSAQSCTELRETPLSSAGQSLSQSTQTATTVHASLSGAAKRRWVPARSYHCWPTSQLSDTV